ncbi:MAG: hypothetical protein HQ564_06670 [Candidatus Saganbacteria bacterium]|nr:hypothetical protein [Candidatus Saganbacteria bacterium]
MGGISPAILFGRINTAKAAAGKAEQLGNKEQKAVKGVDLKNADANKDGNVSGLEFSNFILAQKNPVTIEFAGKSYKVENGKIEEKIADAPKKTERWATPDKAPLDPYEQIHDIFKTMFKREIPPEMKGEAMGFIEGLKHFEAKGRGYIRPNSGVFSNTLKKYLAFILMGDEDHARWISDKSLDFFFGNQDGKLNDDDKISIVGLLERLKAYLPYIMTLNAQGNGSGAWAILQGEIHYVDFGKMAGYSDKWDFNSLSTKSPLKRNFIYAQKAYQESVSGKEKARREKEIKEMIKSGSIDYNKMSRELRQLVMVSAQAHFRHLCYQYKETIDWDKELKLKGDLLKKFTQGMFRKWLENGTLPEEVNKEAIEADYIAYNKEIAQREAAKPKEPPKKALPDSPPSK